MSSSSSETSSTIILDFDNASQWKREHVIQHKKQNTYACLTGDAAKTLNGTSEEGIPLYATLTLQNLLKFNEQEEKAEGLFLQCISPHYRNLIDAEEVPPGDHLIIRCDYHLTESGIEESTVRLAISSLCTSRIRTVEFMVTTSGGTSSDGTSVAMFNSSRSDCR